MDRNINIVGQFEEVFEEYPMMVKELSGFHHNVFANRGKSLKVLEYCFFWGCGQLFADFRFWRGSWNLNPCEKRGMCVFVLISHECKLLM